MDEYIYGVARIRALESFLLTDDDISQIIEAKDYDTALQFIIDKGWGNGSYNLDEIVREETAKHKKVVDEIIKDASDKDILMVDYDYHNLKAAIKKVCTDSKIPDESIYVEGRVDTGFIEDCIRESEYDKLPDEVSDAAKRATDALLKSGDGQLCDVIVDKALLERIMEIKKNHENTLIRDYADMKVAIADIKIAIRAALSGKDDTFLKNALVECEGISVTDLIASIKDGIDGVCDYLSTTAFSDLATAIKKSKSYFECKCDNKIIDRIKNQKYESFSVGPILAYSLARENEIKTVKIILSGKMNGFDNDFIRERVRIMYA